MGEHRSDKKSSRRRLLGILIAASAVARRLTLAPRGGPDP
jgi:hypothetical protein